MISPDTFVCIDIETTGLDPDLNEIIEIGAVKVGNGELIDEFSMLVKPERSISDFIKRLTGISNEDVKYAESIDEVVPPLLRFLRGYCLLGHNVKFDVGFLRKAAGIGSIETAIDNIELARIILPQLPSYNLDSLIDFFALTPEKRHRALHDAKLTAVIFLKLIDMLRLIPDGRFKDLHRISSKTGSVINEVFEAQLKERQDGTSPAVSGPTPEISPYSGINNNIFGDISPDRENREDHEASIDPEVIESLFNAGGELSRYHESFEERPGQIMMAKRIARAFNESEILLAEAGTGTGKSIAYLLPSILWAEESRERVVISTNTKNLQEQLFSKDIPLLGKVLDFKFRAVILKGRGNYICRNRWGNVINNPGRMLSKRERNLLLPVAAWLQTTKSGDLSETGFFAMLSESGLLSHINSESSSCRGARCPERERCYVSRIRKAAQRSHVIIVNHSLVFSDMVAGGGVLGQYNRIIFDEAHNIEKVALRFLGVSFNYFGIRRILNRLYNEKEGKFGLFAVLSEWVQEMVRGWPEYAANETLVASAIDAIHTVRSMTGELFGFLDSAVRHEASRGRKNHAGKLRYTAETDMFNDYIDQINSWADSIAQLVHAAADCINFVKGVSLKHLEKKEDILLDLEEARKDLIALNNDFAFLLEAGGKNVFWIEYAEEDNPYKLSIHSAPLDVAEMLSKDLYDIMETVIMTSATLAVARDFSYIRERLGLDLDSRERTTDFIASSPFDLNRQAAIVIPSYLPSPKQENFIDVSNDCILRMAKDVRRGMLVLFTSWGHLNRAYNYLKEPFSQSGITLLGQGIDGSRSLLLQRFREEPVSVLFGTDSFWEGVDVPGHALEIVVISRLPFAVPSDPIIEAQMEEIERSGGNPFIEYSVPEAAIKLRQGAGRLIRHRSDRGVVVIMDKRVITTRYGSLFKRSLSGSSLRAENEDMLVDGLKQWFGS